MTSSTVARDLESSPAAAAVPLPDIDAVDALVGEMRAALKAEQRPDGHWLFELEADATIPAEYIFLQHFLGKVDTPGFRPVEPKIANHLRAIQGRHGGWPLFHDGDIDVSASVQAYFALKLAGDDPEPPHMQRDRAAILAAGGPAQSNVFTRIPLALFGQDRNSPRRTSSH